MTNVYQPEAWRDLFVMIGGSAASLLGLLFVVMSLHYNAFRQNLDYDMRATIHAARNNTYHLLTAMLTAGLILAPQPPLTLGVELVGIHLFGLRLPISFTYMHFIRRRGGFPITMTITISIGYLLGAAAGVTFIRHPDWALYLATASCLTLMVRSVLTAWMLMFERRHDVAPRSAKRASPSP